MKERKRGQQLRKQMRASATLSEVEGAVARLHTLILFVTFAAQQLQVLMPASSKPNFLWSILTMKCPRCRRGRMFRNSNPWNLRKVFDMPTRCEECGQPFELEVGFWYGTGYVSYALSVALSVTSFVAWYVLIGMSTKDNRFFWWLGTNVFLLIAMQPWIMRLSRVIYLYFFVRYDRDYKKTDVKKFDYETGSYYEGDSPAQ